MSKEKDQLDGDSGYTLDDILAEYSDNQTNSLNDKVIDIAQNGTTDDVIDIAADDISDTDEVNDTTQVFTPPAHEDSVLEGVSAVPVFDDANIRLNDILTEADAEKAVVFSELTDEETKVIEETLSDFMDNTAAEFGTITAEAIADSVDVFAEELEEENVPEELANQEPEQSDVIYADNDDGEAADETTDIIPDISADEKSDEDINVVWWKKICITLFPVKGDGIAEVIRKIIFLCASVVFIGAGVMLISTLVQSRLALNDQEELRTMFTTTVATSIDENGNTVTIKQSKEDLIIENYDLMKSLHERFENVVAFIEIEACDISYPVVQCEDNDYYLTHTYYDSINKAGAIFLDYRSTLSAEYTSPNLVLYGHNQQDGTMFGNLKYYKKDDYDNIDFYKNNPEITLRTLDGIDEYVIYGFFITNALAKQDSKGEVFHYHDYIEVLKDEYTFKWYMNEILNRNQIISPVDVQYGDELLLLSTCSNEFSDSRFVVCARKLRDNETIEDFDFASTKVNYNAKKLDWFAITSGDTTTEVTTEGTTEMISLGGRKTTTSAPDEEDTETTKKTKKTKTTESAGTISGETTVTTVPEAETSKTSKTSKTQTETSVTTKENIRTKATTTTQATTTAPAQSEQDTGSSNKESDTSPADSNS